MTDREKLIDKIRKLLAKAKGTDNQDEAAVFAQKAHELLLRNELDLDEIQAEGQEVSEKVIGTRHKPRYDTPWFRGLAVSVAKYYMCGMVRYKIGGQRGTETYAFVGRESRTLVAAEMFGYLEKTIYRLSNEASNVGVIRRNFQKGAAVNMAYRISRMMEKVKTDNPGNLPALYDQAAAEIQDFFAKEKVKTLKTRALELSGPGYHAGVAAANNISMNTQVNASAKNRSALLTSK